MAKSKMVTRTLTMPDGRRKYFRGKTKEEVEKKVLAAKMELKAGIDISDNTTFAEFAQLWYDTFKKKQLREKSLEVIRNALNNHILPHIGQMRVRDVKAFHVQRIMAAANHLSRSSQSKILVNLKQVFQVAVDNGIIARSPVASTIKAGGALPEQVAPLTQAQSDALLTRLAETRAFDFVLLAIYAGLRCGEALGVRWSDVDYDAGCLHIRRSIVFTNANPAGVVNEELKTAAARRDIPLPLPVLAHLRKQEKTSRSEYVLSMGNGAHLSRGSFAALWRVVVKRTVGDDGLASGFSVHPHQLRHTCITRWFEAGLDLKQIQYLAGHTTVALTLKIYTHYDRESRSKETTDKIQAAVPELPATLRKCNVCAT